jgi:hypothetical protein
MSADHQHPSSSLLDGETLFDDLEMERADEGASLMPLPTLGQLLGVVAWLVVEDMRSVPVLGWVVTTAVACGAAAYLITH